MKVRTSAAQFSEIASGILPEARYPGASKPLTPWNGNPRAIKKEIRDSLTPELRIPGKKLLEKISSEIAPGILPEGQSVRAS